MTKKANSWVLFLPASMANFLTEDYERRAAEYRRREHKYYSVSELAREIGVVVQSLQRWMTGEVNTMELPQAKQLIAYYKAAILEHFDYCEASALDKPAAITLAGLYSVEMEENAREDMARAILAASTMEPERRKALISLIEKLASGEIGLDQLIPFLQTT